MKNDSSSYGIQGALRVRSVVLFQASSSLGAVGYPWGACSFQNCIQCDRVRDDLDSIDTGLQAWSSFSGQQMHALQSIVFDAVGRGTVGVVLRVQESNTGLSYDCYLCCSSC